MSSPAELSRAERALAAASTVEEVKSIYDVAEAYRVYASNAAEQNRAATVKLRAAAKGGVMLAEMPKRGHNRPQPDSLSVSLGIESDAAAQQLSSRWQKVAELDRVGKLNDYLDAEADEVTMAGLFHYAEVPFDTEHSGQEAWFTPAWVFKGLGLTFDLDVAAPPGGVPWIPARRYFTEADDGLAQPWEGVVWCNPPYSAPTPWCKRFAEHDEMALLIRADLSVGGPFAAITAAEAVWVPAGRLDFVDGVGDVSGKVTFSTVMFGRGATVLNAMYRLADTNGTTRRLT
jgi:phage N-6-adenine-methyltransferase